MRREHRHPASSRRIVGLPRRLHRVGGLLRGARWIRAIVVVGRRPLGSRLMLMHRGHAVYGTGRVGVWRAVLPHVDPSLRRPRQLADVVHGVVAAGVREIHTLTHQLGLGEEATLGTVAGHARVAAHGAAHPVVDLLLHVVVRGRLVDADEVRPTNLRWRSWIRSEK